MPSTNESASQEPGRKKDRACDACRRRKIKCDGPLMLNHVCTNCIQTRKPCSYVEASRPRGPPKAYISNLEDRLEELEALLQQIHPGVDFSEELGPPVVRGSWKTQDGPSRASSSSIGRTPSLASNVLPPLLVPYHQAHSNDCTSQTPVCLPSLRSTHLTFRSRRRSKRDSDATLSSNSEESSEESPSSSSETEEILITSVGGREKITLRASENDDTTDDNNIRFHGRSSTAGLVETTRQFKHMHIRETMSPTQKNSPRTSPDNLTVAQWRRPEFWQRPSWEYSYEGGRAEPSETLQTFVEYFPPPDLADTLIGLYFGNSNLTFPLLHRPTFDRQWQQGLHHRNVWFAGVCMSMFAIASRWCDDERVLPEAPTAESPQGDWRRAGRHYFDIAVEIHLVRRSLFHQPSLFEVQTFALIGMYLRSTAAFPSAWTVISAGLRKAQDVGAHRKKVYRTEPNIDDELWKRVFWLLVILDRLGGASLGRACGIAEEDFDLDFPLEVDDEYLEANKNQHERFKQPPGVPSTMTAFVQLIKLTQIMAFAMRTLYAIDKSKIYHGFVPLEQQSITEQLSLAMSEWLERVPEHLRWHDKMDNPVFFHQSASLFTLYHLTQMLVYRPLIAMSPSPPTPTESNFINHADSAPLIPALADPAIIICTEAARSCARIVEAELRHGIRKFYIPSIINVSYICAGLFLVHAWNLKVQEKEFRKRGIPDIKPPLANRIEQGIMDAKIFLRALEEVKPRWDIVDMLLEELQESLVGLEPQPAEQVTPRPTHDTFESDGTLSKPPNDKWRPSHSAYNQEHHEQPAEYSTSSASSLKDSRQSPSVLPFKYIHSVAELGSSATAAPTTWNERALPYISSRRRPASSKANTRNVQAPSQETSYARSTSDITENKPTVDTYEATVKHDHTNVHFDNQMHLTTPRFPHQGSHSNSPPKYGMHRPSRGLYEGLFRMDAWGPMPHNGLDTLLHDEQRDYMQDLYNPAQSL